MIKFVKPWEPIEGDAKIAAEAELTKEIGERHPLYGRSAKAIGRRIDCDDVLFLLDSETTECAVVHLVWQGQKESDPKWPTTEVYKSLDDWKEKRMMCDHDDYCV